MGNKCLETSQGKEEEGAQEREDEEREDGKAKDMGHDQEERKA